MCNFMSARKCAFRIIRSVSVFAIVDGIQTVVASPAMDGGGHREREREWESLKLICILHGDIQFNTLNI